MEVKRQLDLLDKHLADSDFMVGESYTIADIAIWPWYGGLVLGRLYGAKEFLSVHEYTNLIRWAKKVEERLAVRRGRMVNRDAPVKDAGYEDIPNLKERHSRKDWEKPVTRA